MVSYLTEMRQLREQHYKQLEVEAKTVADQVREEDSMYRKFLEKNPIDSAIIFSKAFEIVETTDEDAELKAKKREKKEEKKAKKKEKKEERKLAVSDGGGKGKVIKRISNKASSKALK